MDLFVLDVVIAMRGRQPVDFGIAGYVTGRLL
jgi:hypothetical protein